MKNSGATCSNLLSLIHSFSASSSYMPRKFFFCRWKLIQSAIRGQRPFLNLNRMVKNIFGGKIPGSSCQNTDSTFFRGLPNFNAFSFRFDFSLKFFSSLKTGNWMNVFESIYAETFSRIPLLTHRETFLFSRLWCFNRFLDTYYPYISFLVINCVSTLHMTRDFKTYVIPAFWFQQVCFVYMRSILRRYVENHHCFHFNCAFFQMMNHIF